MPNIELDHYLSAAEKTEILRWCEAHCLGRFRPHHELAYDTTTRKPFARWVFEFERDIDAIHFKLRWY